MFCILCRNSRWPPKNGGKVIFAKCGQYTLQIPCGSKIFVEIALSHTVSEVNALLRRKSRGLPKVAGKRLLQKKLPVESAYILCAKKFRRNRSILQLRRWKQIRVFAVLAKIQNGRHF